MYKELPQPDLLPRAVLLLWSAALLATIVAAPLAASAARPEGWFLYQALEPFCHQRLERSWHLQDYPLAACVRCAGVYTGLLLAALLAVRLPAGAIAIALALLGASWAAEYTGLSPVPDSARFVTGMILGCTAGVVLLSSQPRAIRAKGCSITL